jgi:hypothetical protein
MRVWLKPVRLYLEDVEALHAVLEEVSDGPPKIETAEYELATPAELQQLRVDTLYELTMRSVPSVGMSPDSPYVSAAFERNGASLYAAADDVLSRGAVDRMREIVAPRQRRFVQVTASSAVIGAAAGISFSGAFFAAAYAVWWGLALALGGLAFSILWWRWMERPSFREYSQILPRYRREAPSFVKRNRDALVLVAVSAAVTAASTVILTLLLSH